MSKPMTNALERLARGKTLTSAEADAVFGAIMDGAVEPGAIGAFLMGLRVQGETPEMIAAGARALRARALRVDAPGNAIDTCGTGGDAKGTHNISTAVSFVVAACGVPVAKHGNRALSSRTGAADVLRALGVAIELAPEGVAACIKEAGVGFLFAPAHHSAMRHVAPVRAAMGVRTIFNLLGPLSNPAGVKRQLLGVFAREWVEPLAHVLKMLGSERAWVVHGADGMDEITTTGATHIAALEGGKVRTFELTPEEAGLARAKPDDLKGGDAAYNADAIHALFEGAPGAFRDIVLLNSAAALIVAERAETLKDAVAMAADAIDTHRAREALAGLVRVSQKHAQKT